MPMIGPPLRFLEFLVIAGIFALALGCTPTAQPPPPNGGPPPMGAPTAELAPGPFLDGRKVFQAHDCIKCHSIGDAPAGKGRMKKSLTTVGTDHPREWIIAHIRDPKSHNAKSKMPASDTTAINDTDMAALADYLTSLK